MQRGHFPNRLRLRPITELTIHTDWVAFTKGGRQHRYKWDEIRSARIVSEDSFKGYGKGAFGKIIMRTLTLECDDGRHWAFDVSGQFPDFEKSRELLGLLHEHLPIAASPIKRFNDLPWIVAIIVGFMILFAFERCGF